MLRDSVGHGVSFCIWQMGRIKSALQTGQVFQAEGTAEGQPWGQGQDLGVYLNMGSHRL